MKRFTRAVQAALTGLALAMTACGQNPETTEKARGVLEGAPLVLALSVLFIVIAGALVVGAIGLDRFVRTRRALETAPPAAVEEEEEEEEVVAGIGVGRAGVPRWLYGFYVLIPLFAFLYVVNNVSLRPAAEERPEAPKAPIGPVTETTVVASGIKFDTDKLVFKANSEITINFDNRDAGVPHNFTIWPDEAAAQGGDTSKAILQGSNITGASKKVEKFKSPASGTLYFDCTIHPTSMFGTIEIAAG